MSKGAKNDRNDAQAILTALQQPQMRFVTVKSVDQQAILAWHRLRKGWSNDRTELMNRVRGLLAEFGIWVGQSANVLLRALPEMQSNERLPPRFRSLLVLAREQIQVLDARLEQCDQEIEQHAKTSEDAQRIRAIIGVGPLTASAAVVTITNARDFKNGRQLAAWAGLVPQQYSSGGKIRLGHITKRGDTYLRGLLTQGARSTLLWALKRAPEKRSHLERWIVELAGRVGYQKTLVAIANKHARMIWAILAKGEAYDPLAWQRYQPMRAA
jgi:transposase